MRALTVRNISKRYFFTGAKPYSAREFFSGMLRFGKSAASKRELWALKDVSFEVDDGETIGIVGNNGAGKSTLLKILSRITKPTAGTATIRGRVGSLLEVGTGFHNELSGRENIYLNGAILGMKRSEIDEKFDEIVEFSEVEKFLDTPVKHYSSGMYMRLAFAVAAHLETEVLIVDEVLAVGDVGFQRKCLNKMRDVGRSGRTIIFVSHDMQAVTRLCGRVLWIRKGELIRDGETRSVISEYLHEQSKTGAEHRWDDPKSAPGNEIVRLCSVRVCDDSRETISTADIREEIGIEMTFEVLESGKILVPAVQFNNEQGVCMFVSHDWASGWRNKTRPKGEHTSTVWIPGNFLSEGSVFVTVSASTHSPAITHFSERDAVTFNVVDSPDGDTARGDLNGPIPGVVRPILKWESEDR